MAKSSMKYVGVDGCKAGWVCIGLDDDRGHEAIVKCKFEDVVNYYSNASLVLVDMPIGLPRDQDHCRERVHYRDCDCKARKLLGSPRLHSVFPVPTKELAREVSQKTPLEQINKELKSRCARRMSPVTYGIAPKIHEVAQVLADPTSGPFNVREIHPELCFWGLNKSGGKNRSMHFGKHDGLGFLERFRIAKGFVPKTEEICKDVLSRPSRRKVGTDDILDALVAAVTAKLGCQNTEYELRKLPGQEPTNCNESSKGNEMLYAVKK